MANSKIVLSDGNKIPSIGFGTWLHADPELLEKSLEAALETGYRHIDTATLYGNEHVIGNVLKRWFDQGKLKREEVFVTTKLPPNALRPLQVIDTLRLSLEKLQLTMVRLTWTEEQLKRIVGEAKILPANIQVEMHAYFQQRSLRALCKELGVSITAYSVLGSSGRSEFHAAFKAPFTDMGILDDPVVKEISEKLNKTPAQILMRFLLQLNVIVLCKSAKPERVRENIDVFNFKLSPEDVSRLEKLDKDLEGRSFAWTILPGILQHPEYPYKEVLFASISV
ncbi:unnamed protein product [Allacma fusca]|uniref:NADP-dependent oxidoreductase domain-containing protein n=1 Tax=Allacma fusca TaxID=39272 RepID=A0A8J2L952_9HEXA|nr:unnamed protein product [Allacma fusca]